MTERGDLPAEPEAMVRAWFDAANAMDVDRWYALLDEDVQLWTDGQSIRGRDEARAWVAGLWQTFPGMVAVANVVAARGGCVVCEVSYVNTGPEQHSWQLGGVSCDVFVVVDGRIRSFSNYYVPSPADATDHGPMPERVWAYRIADEHAALRTVATLAAGGASEEQLFAAVAEGTGKIAAADATALFRFGPDDTFEMLAAWTVQGGDQPLGERRPLNDELRAVRDAGRPVRYQNVPGNQQLDDAPFAEEARRFGLQSSVGVPIVVDQQVWGIAFANSTRPAPLPPDTEERVARFAELVAVALGNVQARARIQQLADEQAALRRVAELVARARPLDEIVDAVARETAALTGGEDAWLPPDDAEREALLTQFADLTAIAVAGAESRAQLRASRARVVATADETRRTMQRDVHDGAQQRLVQTVLTLTMAREALGDREPDAAGLVDEALQQAEQARVALAELVQGILPAALTRSGLRTGLESLTEGLALPVDLRVAVPRLAPAVETTAYFVVAEALTNVVKHAGATRAQVDVALDGEHLVVEVTDDGRGGADAVRGTGITGLFDRVDALEGTLSVHSPPGAGTRVVATLPSRPRDEAPRG